MVQYVNPTLQERIEYLTRVTYGKNADKVDLSCLSLKDQEDRLIRAYFKDGSDPLPNCIRRAYLDLCRTIHGIKFHPRIYGQAYPKIISLLIGAQNDNSITTTTAFDRWHHNACKKIKSTYQYYGYRDFHIGQSQKWLNMAFKYIYLMGEERISGYAHFYELCHSPIDQIILKSLRSYAPAVELPSSWSRMDNYDQYLDIQNWVRDNFRGSAPLTVEFHLWQKGK